MKTMYKYILSAIFMLMAGQTLQAQEAFYIYCNDGNFDGFFFDEVISMGYSKFDLDGIEHDVYVVQEIETEDSIYRIPLAAIDSIGFQQPDIILSDNFYTINGSGEHSVRTSNRGFYFSDDEGYNLRWSASPMDPDYEKYLPKPGMVIYASRWADTSAPWGIGDGRIIEEAPFVARVVKVTYAEGGDGWYDIKWYDVECEPIEDLSEVFEQLISVEQLGTDETGYVRHRMAGEKNIKQRVSGNKTLTVVNQEGHFPFSRGDDNFEVGMSIDLSLKVRAQVSYNITRKEVSVNVKLKEDAEVGVSFSVKAKLEDATTWPIGGVPIMFPNVLPVFEVNPSPEAFIKTTGDLSLSISSPKYAYHGRQAFHIGTDGVSGDCQNECPPPGSEDNGWSMSIALNGSIQGGSNFPMKLKTISWAKKAIYASIGADVYVGPKISASFSIDPVAAAKGELYNTLSGTTVTISPMTAVFEANAEYSFGNKPKKKEKFFEGERNYFQMELKLFPDFEKTVITKEPGDHSGYGTVKANIMPRGNSVPYIVGVAAYNKDNALIDKTYYTTDSNGDYGEHMYGFFNTFDSLACNEIFVLDGTYKIVPLINAFGYDVPAWGNEVEVTRSLIPNLYGLPHNSDGDNNPTTGLLDIQSLLPTDKVHFDKVRSAFEEVHYSITYGTKKDDRGELRVSETITQDQVIKGEAGSVYFDGKSESTGYVLGPEKSINARYSWSNNCHSWYRESGSRYYWDSSNARWDLIGGSYAPPGFTSQTYSYSYRYEACTYRITVTRADGREFNLGEIHFCGHGKATNSDGDTSEIFRWPGEYIVDSFWKD